MGEVLRVSQELFITHYISFVLNAVYSYVRYYPGSGPAITMKFSLKDKNEQGFYDTSLWTILDPPPPPEDAETKRVKPNVITFEDRKAVCASDKSRLQLVLFLFL